VAEQVFDRHEFDALFQHIADPPPAPVAQNREAFIEWVREHDLPHSGFFSAYPESKVVPDSEKSTTEHIGDTLTGKADSAGSTLQPQGEKSTTQKMGDTVSGNSNESDQSMMGKVKDAVGMGDK